MMINFGQTSKSENEKCKRLSEKSHNYSHCWQEKCFSLSLYPNMMMMVMVMMMPRLVVCWWWWWWDYQCENDDDGDGDCLWGDGDGDDDDDVGFLCSGTDDGDNDIDDDDAKICWFLAYKIHKSCCLWRDGAVQQDLLFYFAIFWWSPIIVGIYSS